MLLYNILSLGRIVLGIQCLSKNKNNENIQTNVIRKSQKISACKY